MKLFCHRCFQLSTDVSRIRPGLAFRQMWPPSPRHDSYSAPTGRGGLVSLVSYPMARTVVNKRSPLDGGLVFFPAWAMAATHALRCPPGGLCWLPKHRTHCARQTNREAEKWNGKISACSACLRRAKGEKDGWLMVNNNDNDNAGAGLPTQVWPAMPQRQSPLFTPQPAFQFRGIPQAGLTSGMPTYYLYFLHDSIQSPKRKFPKNPKKIGKKKRFLFIKFNFTAFHSSPHDCFFHCLGACFAKALRIIPNHGTLHRACPQKKGGASIPRARLFLPLVFYRLPLCWRVHVVPCNVMHESRKRTQRAQTLKK